MGCTIELMEWEEGPVFCDKRFMGLFAGRRTGKTDAIKARIKRRTQKRNFRYTYISPLSSQGEQVWREMIADASWRPRIVTAARRPYPHFFLYNKASIWMRSFQRPEGIRSTGEDEICVDESQDQVVTENAIDTVILPMLADRRGSLLLSGQFRGEDYRYERFFVPGQRTLAYLNAGRDEADIDPELNSTPNPRYNPAFESWRFPTSCGYCFQDEAGRAELELQRSITRPAVWDQEWACIPRANANAVFPAREIDAISIKRNPPIKFEQEPKRGGAYLCSVDIGGKVDQEKVTVAHQSGDIVFGAAFPLDRDEEQNAREAMEIARRFRAPVIIDTTGEEARYGQTKDNRVEKHRKWANQFRLPLKTFTFLGLNKERIIENLRLAIQDRSIGICVGEVGKAICDELKAFECTYNRQTKRYTYQGPDGKRDDYVQCLAMTVEGINRGMLARGTGSIGEFIG